LISVQPTNAGNYDVIVLNSAGSVTSTVALLTVLVPPSITNQPASQAVIQGNNATFIIGAAGTPPLTYQWRFNASALAGATGAQLDLTSVQPTNAGNYDVVVS